MSLEELYKRQELVKDDKNKYDYYQKRIDKILRERRMTEIKNELYSRLKW